MLNDYCWKTSNFLKALKAVITKLLYHWKKYCLMSGDFLSLLRSLWLVCTANHLT